MNLDGPGEVADIDKKGDVRAVAEVKVLVGEAVFELPDVAPGDDGDLLPGLRAGCRTDRQKEDKRETGEGWADAGRIKPPFCFSSLSPGLSRWFQGAFRCPKASNYRHQGRSDDHMV